MKNIFKYLKIGISIILMGALIWIMKDNLYSIGGIIRSANKPLIFLSAILTVVIMIIQSYRLKFLMNAQNIFLNIKDVTCLTFVGQFFNNFMPTTIGGDVIKAHYASNVTKKRLETFASVVMDRVLGVVTLMWIAAAVVIFRYKQIPNKMIIVLIGIIFILTTLGTILIFNKEFLKRFTFLKMLVRKMKLEDKMRRLYEAANKYRHHKSLVCNALLLSLGAQLLSFFMTYLLIISISSKISFVFLLLTLPLIYALSMLPSLNGLGIRESGFIYFLGGAIGKEKAFALSLLYLFAMFVISAIGGIIFLFKRDFKLTEGCA